MENWLEKLKSDDAEKTRIVGEKILGRKLMLKILNQQNWRSR